MRPEIEPQTLNAFVDGELDALNQRAIEERMARDDRLRVEVAALRQLRQNVRDLADYHVAPEALRQRIESMVPVSAPLSTRWSVGKGIVQHWFDWRPMLVSFAAMSLAVLTLNLTWWGLSPNDRLREEVVASHVRSTLSQHLVDVASSDHHKVKPWLSLKLDFSPPMPESLLPGSVFLGGRVDYLDSRPVAALVYQQGEHVVNSFVWPTPAADSAILFSAERGFQIAHWSRAGMSHWVISDVNREEFSAIARAIEMFRSEP
ncbi:anti-sigma factor RsiW [Variovorax sp. GrIS 2.14]|uniref:anti-sigma factor family protein n=1 Tax=Variovorax sp. GrIS 2.14 TaxID=3071709 RepID=UPI0038F78C74